MSVSVLPRVVRLHTSSSFSLNPAGTGTRKMKRLRRGRKCVGWPWSAFPAVKRLSGPTGTSSSSCQLRFM